MAMPMPDLPLPPELATEAPPIPDDELDQLLEWAVASATDDGVSPAEAVELLAESEGAPRWQVSDLGGAEWAMRHVAEADQALAGLHLQRQAWAERIDQWFAQAAGKEQARRAFFARHLQRYAIEQREASGGHTKSVTMPSGVVRTTEHKPKAAVTDEAAVVTWVTCWFPEAVAEVCPPVAPKVYLAPLRKVTTVVEVIDHARLVLAKSAEVIEWVRDDPRPPADTELVPGVVLGDSCPEQGDGWPTPEDATDLVAMVQVLASHPEVHDANGKPVPGTEVEPGHVSAKVTAEQP